MRMLLLFGVWAVLVVAIMVVRVSPRSWPFWLLVGSAVGVGGVYVLLSALDGRRTQRAIANWLGELERLVDVHDFDDDGHLAECLDESERRRVIEELERMPRGSRSLRSALSVVSPDLIRDEG